MTPKRLLIAPISAAAGPLYQQIVDGVKREISEERLPPGTALPSFRALAEDLLVSVITVKRAYLELEHAGVIVTRQGRGTFVAENVNIGTSLKEEELEEHLGAAAEIAQLLGLDAAELETRLRKVQRNLVRKKQ